jgi:hypothetical protein
MSTSTRPVSPKEAVVLKDSVRMCALIDEVNRRLKGEPWTRSEVSLGRYWRPHADVTDREYVELAKAFELTGWHVRQDTIEGYDRILVFRPASDFSLKA